MTEPPIRFQDDDDGYVAWTSEYLFGFVINCCRSPTPDYLVLHRADCMHITVPFSGGNHWTKDYIKICARRRADLLAWAREEIGGEPSRCGSCAP